MNLNDGVAPPNNKDKSVKLNARNLRKPQVETVTVEPEMIKKMEERLQQLKERMSKEREERRLSGGFKWKSGQLGSLRSYAPTHSTKKDMGSRLQKLSAGKLRIRVLKDEIPTGPLEPQPPPMPPTIGLGTTRKIKTRGRICGQCEVKTTRLMCAECTEDFCIDCFDTFHQKGALKLHRTIPIQTDIRTHVSTQDFVSCFQTKVNASPNSKPNPDHTFLSNTMRRPGEQITATGLEALAKHMESHPSQILFVNDGEEQNEDIIEEGGKQYDDTVFPSSLLEGEYHEEESARSFQEALRQWTGERHDGAGKYIQTEEAMWTPVEPVSVSAVGTQTDLPRDRGSEGQGERGGHVPVRVEFTKNSLTYMDKLLLKKLRRTPIPIYHPLLEDLKSQYNTNTEEEAASVLTAEDEDFRRYFASLFAVPVGRVKTEPEIAPESCLTIEVMYEQTDRDKSGVLTAEQRTDVNRQIHSVQEPQELQLLKTQISPAEHSTQWLWSHPSEESTATLSCTPRMNFNETLVGATGDNGSQDPRGSRCGSRVSEDQQEEDQGAQSDHQSFFLDHETLTN